MSDEDIRSLETEFHVKLPPEYVEFLLQTNGGIPSGATCFDYTLTNGKLVKAGGVVGCLNYVTSDKEDIGGVWESTQLLRSEFQEIERNTKVIAIGVDGADNMIYLDMSNDPPNVFIHYYSSNNSTPKIADSFEQFIDGLYPHPDA